MLSIIMLLFTAISPIVYCKSKKSGTSIRKSQMTVFILAQPQDLACSCYMLGTHESSSGESICRPDNLQCKCLPHVTGSRCDQCERGFYNIFTGQGCLDCLCDPDGTNPNTTCDSRGKCNCKQGYKG